MVKGCRRKTENRVDKLNYFCYTAERRLRGNPGTWNPSTVRGEINEFRKKRIYPSRLYIA